jgi:hypothetical protein
LKINLFELKIENVKSISFYLLLNAQVKLIYVLTFRIEKLSRLFSKVRVNDINFYIECLRNVFNVTNVIIAENNRLRSNGAQRHDHEFSFSSCSTILRMTISNMTYHISTYSSKHNLYNGETHKEKGIVKL